MSRHYSSCSECVILKIPGYCAPLRCYCGHKECSAYASYIDTKSRHIDASELKQTSKLHANSWANREEETWIERL